MRLLLPVSALVAFASIFESTLTAQTVNLSNSANALPSLQTARYRIDNLNWDMAIYNERQGPPPPTSADFVTMNLGNQTQLSGDTFKFSLQNIAGQGLVFRLFDNNDANGPAGGTVGWGTFGPAIPAGPFTNVAADLNGELPSGAFNAINFELRAFAMDSQWQLSNVAFTGATVLGSIAPITAMFDNTGSSYVAALTSDTNLASFDWTLSGSIMGVKTTGGQEQVAFNLQMAMIPEPSVYAVTLATVGLAMVALRRRRAQSRI